MFRGGSPASGIAAITGGNVAQVQRCALPMVRSNSGNMGNNGAYVAGTAYGKIYAKCLMYFAVNQIAAGVAAGWYYAEGSSTTAFTIFNNVYTAPGFPALPASKTAFATTGPGAITGDLTEQGLVIPIPANALGVSGWWKLRARFTNNNTVGTKTERIRYSDIGGTQLSGAANTTIQMVSLEATVVNQSVANAQEIIGTLTTSSGTTAGSLISLAIDTTALTKPAVTTIIGTATDWAVMEWAIFELMTDGT